MFQAQMSSQFEYKEKEKIVYMFATFPVITTKLTN